MRAYELCESKLSQNDIADAIQSYAEGQSYNEIARRYGVDRKTIVYHITKQPDYPELRAQHWSAAQYEYTGAVNFSLNDIRRMHEMYLAGQSYENIGRVFGINGESVARNIKRYDPNVTARERTPTYAVRKHITRDTAQRWAQLLNSGSTISDIAKQYDVDRKTVRYHLQKLQQPVTENDSEHRDALRSTGFWGRRGAGCLFLARDTRRLCIAHRSEYVEQPNTWGTWGGAIDGDESPEVAVKREAQEESGYVGPLQLVPLYVFKHPSGFTYYNYLAIVESEFEPQLDWETQGYVWTECGDWPSPLHPGLKLLLNDASSMRTIQQYCSE